MAKIAQVLANPGFYLKKHGVRGFAARMLSRPLAGMAAQRVKALDKHVFNHVPVQRPDEGRTIGFSPYFPHVHGYAIRKICKALSLHPVHGLDADLKMFWHDITVAPESPQGAINWRVRDISKERVGSVFDRTFGYRLTLDPETHSGMCVEKADENGVHIAAVVECPRQRRSGFVYQRVVDNRMGHLVEDLRAVIVGNEIALVYIKHRPLHDRFSNMNTRVQLAEGKSVFSAEELEKILEFCDTMGVDYGEIDILRDRGDDRIYIVDVNKTTFGPPNHLPMKHRFEAVKLMAHAFERQFLS